MAAKPVPKMWTEQQVDSFLARCPKPAKTGNNALDSRAEVDFAALKVVVKTLMMSPERILPTSGGLETNTVGASRVDASGGADLAWGNDIKHVSKVPDW